MTDPEMPTLARSVTEGCRALGIGRTLMDELIGRGEIKTFRLGRRRLIPESELQRLIRERLEAEASA